MGGLLEEDVGVPLTPGVRTSEVQRMIRSNAVDRIPGDHKGDTEFGELIVNRVGCRPVDTSSQEYDWTLRRFDSGGDKVERPRIDRLEIWKGCRYRQGGYRFGVQAYPCLPDQYASAPRPVPSETQATARIALAPSRAAALLAP